LLCRSTVGVILRQRLVDIGAEGISYSAGDHVGILAENRAELVEGILTRLVNTPPSLDDPVQVQLLQEKYTPMGKLL
jgi:sulfite reductase alpha subunit-like flavoprotein